jgi:hypothetical protein
MRGEKGLLQAVNGESTINRKDEVLKFDKNCLPTNITAFRTIEEINRSLSTFITFYIQVSLFLYLLIYFISHFSFLISRFFSLLRNE